MTELKVGTQTADGVFAGLTPDGKQQIYAMRSDLCTRMTFNNAAECVKILDAEKYLGHDDWKIPSLDILHILQRNQKQGSLKDTFNQEAEEAFSDCYWSSTTCYADSSSVKALSFPDDLEYHIDKNDHQLSCRPVRLVPVTASP